MKTWTVEIAIVATILAAVAVATGNGLAEWIGAFAVTASFGHAQIADRLAERESAREKPDVHCYRKLIGYFLAKESAWLAYFLLHRSYAALIGVGLFLSYPIWRKRYRSRFPLERQ